MARVALISPPFLPEYMRNARCDFVSLSGTQWYPILLGYCGAYLEGRGHDVLFIDAPAAGLDHAAALAKIARFRPELVAVYTGLMSESNDVRFCDDLIETQGTNVVAVGPYASIDPPALLGKAKRLDKLVVGEFERAVGQLIEGVALGAVDGLTWRQAGSLRENSRGSYLTGPELDAIPFVSRFFKKHVHLAHYRTSSEPHPFMDIMTGRGCAWGLCTYCLWVHTYVKGRTYNVRSIGNVIEELRYIQSELPEVRSVMLQDDTLTEERAMALAEAKIRGRLTIPWSCYARAELSYETLLAMKRAGCLNLHVGYESASPRVLKRIRKGISVERMERFTRDAKRAGLHIHGDFALGFPGETMAEAQQTVRMAKRLNPESAQFQLMIPFPGTPFHDDMDANGWLNAEGQPDMPQFSNNQIREVAKHAYRAFYLRPTHLWRCIRHPHRYVFSKYRTIRRAIPAMFWKRWEV
ncbi:MAG: radical SAM protein [Deltaproteobacteria bacterium]|nr:radical SAM protein [Deltaproteobacteria bacterium]